MSEQVNDQGATGVQPGSLINDTDPNVTPPADGGTPPADDGSSTPPVPAVDGDAAPEESTADLIAGKYKTQEELVEGYKELKQKLSEKNPEAPESYELNFADDEAFKPFADLELNLDLANDPLVESMLPVFKEFNISQEAAAALTKAHMLHELNGFKDIGDVQKELGPQANTLIQEANEYVSKYLNAEEQGVAKVMGQSAEGMRLLHKMSQMVGEKSIPADLGGHVKTSSAELISKAMAMSKEPNFNQNTAKIAEYEKLMDQAATMDSK